MSGVDITPLVPAGRQVIERYGGGGFRVSGQDYGGSVLVFPERTQSWPVGDFAEVSIETLAPVLREASAVELLLLGCGARMSLVAPDVRQALREHGVAVEPMATGAACRTYNALSAEARLVAAALIAVD